MGRELEVTRINLVMGWDTIIRAIQESLDIFYTMYQYSWDTIIRAIQANGKTVYTMERERMLDQPAMVMGLIHGNIQVSGKTAGIMETEHCMKLVRDGTSNT